MLGPDTSGSNHVRSARIPNEGFATVAMSVVRRIKAPTHNEVCQLIAGMRTFHDAALRGFLTQVGRCDGAVATSEAGRKRNVCFWTAPRQRSMC
jgi:hypothetical protein